MTSDPLKDTLKELLDSGTTSNPALDRLLTEYARFHAVFVIVGSVFACACAYLSVQLLRQRRRVPNVPTPNARFERRIYLAFAMLGCTVALFLTVALAANISSVANPRQGLVDSVAMIGTPRPGTHGERLHQAFTVWLSSGRAQIPDLVQRAIDDRLAWQRPKAAVCSILLVVVGVTGLRIWQKILRRVRINDVSGWMPGYGRLISGAGAVAGCLLLMLMVIGNTQGAIAPLSMTLVFG